MTHSPDEYLLQNFLDKEFLIMLYPLNLQQNLFFQSKYRILHGFITPNNLFEHCLCVLGAAFVVFNYVFRYIIVTRRLVETPGPIAELNEYDLFGLAIDLLVYGTFCIIISFVNIQQTNRSVELILRMQRAYTVLREDDSGIVKFRKSNWMYLTLLFSAYSFIFLNALVFVSWTDIVWYVAVSYFDSNIMFGIRTVTFLVYELKMLKRELEKFGTMCTSNDPSEHGKKLFRTYLDIIKAFQLSEKVFQASILYLSTEIFAQFLSFVQNVIAIQMGTHFLDEISVFGVYIVLLACAWSIKNFVLLSCLCVICQQFYKAATDIDATCAILLNQEYGTPKYVRRLYKNVHRASSCRGVLRAGGLIEVCAALPLRQLQLLATYTVVLLQFAFL